MRAIAAIGVNIGIRCKFRGVSDRHLVLGVARAIFVIACLTRVDGINLDECEFIVDSELIGV